MSTTNLKKKIGNYTILMDQVVRPIRFGYLYFGTQDGTNERVLIHSINKDQLNNYPELKTKFLSELDHLRNMQVIDAFGYRDAMETNHNFYIIQEYSHI